ncbi:helix-turn-helix domain-containing protein [Phytoactinopolyspora limicola]|uniref:helix-turn-helix domain-containing protein n=1 Tax=Phytoactinopolyspora limicola TaxID=2715536 RepID=UPI0014086E59|nr:helix-turn-helix transcriptional regulator [Phytoactinopolyspora limicola]
MTEVPPQQPIGQIIRAARHRLGMSQYSLAHELATISGRPTMGRDRVARWERGRQVPRSEWRQWLSAVLKVPPEQLDAGAAAARQLNRLGNAAGSTANSSDPRHGRRMQGTPALLPVFRSRVAAGVLAAVLLNPDRAFSLTELAEHAGASLASVSKESVLLENAGILCTRNDGAIRLTQAASDRPMLGPLTELIRVTYGVPQVIGEEFGQVPGITRIALTGTWAERFGGVPGPEPDNIQVRLVITEGVRPDRDALAAAVRRAERRLKRPVRYRLAPLSLRPGVRRSNGTTPPRAVPPAPLGPTRAAGPAVRPSADVTLRDQGARPPVVHVKPVAPPDSVPVPDDETPTGAELIDKLVDDGQLELISGPTASGVPYFDLAEQHLTAADHVAATTPGSAFMLICQAAQLIGRGLLAGQGLRLTPGTDTATVSKIIVVQFGTQFGHVELMRRRMLAMNNPIGRDSRATVDDVEAYLPTVRSMLKEARDQLPELGLYT